MSWKGHLAVGLLLLALAAALPFVFQVNYIVTQVTLQDGDTIAIGGIIQETETNSSAGVPVLHRLPVIGAAFGAKSMSCRESAICRVHRVGMVEAEMRFIRC